MSNHAFRKTMFLPVLLLFICLLSMPVWASVWQVGSDANSVTISWDSPPEAATSEGTLVSFTIEWGQGGYQQKAVVGANIRTHTISGLSSDAAYDVRVKYKYLRKDDSFFDGTSGEMIATTDIPEENTVSNNQVILGTGKTHKASELSFLRYIVRDDSSKSTCTINMDQDVTVKEIWIYDGVNLVLTGNGTLTVAKGISQEPRVGGGGGNLQIQDNVSLKVGSSQSNWAISVGDLFIDTTGRITATGLSNRGKRSKTDSYGHGGGVGISCESLRILNGTVIATGEDDESYSSEGKTYDFPACAIGCSYYFLMTGGNVTARGCSYGLSCSGDAQFTLGNEGTALQMNLAGTRAAVIMKPGSSKNYLGIGDFIIDSPVALTTPAGGTVALKDYKLDGDNYTAKFIVDASGNIARNVEIKIPLIYSVEASLMNSSIKVGDTTQMKYETKASDFSTVTGSVYRFTSDDEKVATVDANGLVKGIGPGKTKITVTDTAHGSVSASVEVAVTENTQSGGSQTGGTQTGGESQTGGSQIGGTPTGGAQAGGTPTGGAQTGGSQTGGTQTGGTQTGGTQTETLQEEEHITINKTPSSVKVKAKKNKLTVSWKKIKNKDKALIKRIQVQVATDPAFEQIVVDKMLGKKKTSLTMNLQKKTRYFVRVRYVGADGVSAWSKVKSAKTK